jgi:hypothetical protein
MKQLNSNRAGTRGMGCEVSGGSAKRAAARAARRGVSPRTAAQLKFSQLGLRTPMPTYGHTSRRTRVLLAGQDLRHHYRDVAGGISVL